ncbi:cd4-specific ankyrin repeat protein [Stylonychia lemnae]|uniref:Cd4-specific ankyrin repeat protein n=1 Tax=Stylonychia lemnae TaxID=5949 RepID=A0A078AUY6_STYLE|nr:cd4-specific ankyrin repeat protein [Stylonychia lemnae]|eukprot:CDW86205.1 cd4-specific ankyrin repeat protein [Stylonychia lemnae]
MLWDSIRKDQFEHINVILSANFPVNAPLNILGLTALHYACSSGNQQVLDTIFNFNPDVNYGRTPLHMAASNNQITALNMLLNQPTIDINAQSSGGETALHKAIAFSSRESIEILMQHHPNLTLQNTSGFDPVQFSRISSPGNNLFNIVSQYLTTLNYPPLLHLQQNQLQITDQEMSEEQGN